jgi:hypothetical protein
MSPENLIQWLRNPSLLNRESMIQLKALLDDYPCFTIARVLYLKNIQILKDLRFSRELVKTAISVPDRRRLYYFIEEKKLPECATRFSLGKSNEDGFSIIDRFLHENTADSVLLDVLQEGDYLTDSKAAIAGDDVSEYAILPEAAQKAVPAIDRAGLSQGEESFTLDYLRYLSRQAVSPSNEGTAKPMPGQDLIDTFLAQSSCEESRIPIKFPSALESNAPVPSETEAARLERLASEIDLPEDSFTETLAKIYLKQKRYDRALEIFKSLSLKYPEKNVYFADQIRFLEKLIINIKK